MTKFMVLATSATIFGCGPNFGGTFKGTLSDAETCSDGSGSNTSAPETFTITDKSGALTLVIGGSCDPLTARAAGNSATIAAKSCPDQSMNGITLKQSIISGTLTLNEPGLAVSISATDDFSNGTASATCNEFVTGTLIRQAN